MRNSWGDDWGEDGYIRIAIRDGDGVCGMNQEVTFPNIYFLSVFDQATYLTLCSISVLLSLWPLMRLSWCKSDSLLYLHEGQKGLVRVAFTTLAFYLITIILFSMSLGAPPMPTWMIYRSSIFLLYGSVHTFLCLLHYCMSLLDRLKGEKIRSHAGFSRIKAIIFSAIIFVLALAAFILLLLENKGVSSYEDEDDAKFERRHSVKQMRNMMLSLNLGCFLLNIFFVRNLAGMVSRANRERGSTNCIHYVALAFS